MAAYSNGVCVFEKRNVKGCFHFLLVMICIQHNRPLVRFEQTKNVTILNTTYEIKR